MRRTLVLIATCCLVSAGSAWTQENGPQSAMIPVATESDVNCSGFFVEGGVRADIRVVDRADNDLMGVSRVSTEGEFVYLAGSLGSVQAGSEWRLVRPDAGTKPVETWNAGELGNQLRPAQPWFANQIGLIRGAGQPYTDVGKIKVIRVTPAGAVARVLSTCEGTSAGDLAIPYKAREIPLYDPAIGFDRFAPATGKLQGSIIAGKMATPLVTESDIAFVNLGSSNALKPGQRLLIFHVRYGQPLIGSIPATPRENIGEMVVVSVNEKSAAAKVILSIREISVGDGVELE